MTDPSAPRGSQDPQLEQDIQWARFFANTVKDDVLAARWERIVAGLGERAALLARVTELEQQVTRLEYEKDGAFRFDMNHPLPPEGV